MFKLLIYRLKRIHHFFSTLLLKAVPANLIYGFPSRKLKIIAITGTDGKTTTSTLTYHLLQQAGKKVGLISTVAAYIGDRAIDTGFHVTTPGPWQLQKLLKRFVDEGYEYVVLESTSHGIYQYRLWGVKFWLAGLTNITQHEALDYHITFAEYIKAKCELLNSADQAWINGDESTPKLVHQLVAANKRHLYRALAKIPDAVKKAIQQRWPESYNHANATLAYLLAEQTGITDNQAVAAITNFPGVPGRMQHIPNNLGRTIIVDFAHTPNALYQALTSVRQQVPAGKKLIAVFGCAGLRDPGKRAPMGAVATKLADIAIFTAEDPRTEDIWSIIRQMKEQLTTGHDKIVSIPDRAQAITTAIQDYSQKGDYIIICGKGHEQSMAYGRVEYPWNDVEFVKSVILNS